MTMNCISDNVLKSMTLDNFVNDPMEAFHERKELHCPIDKSALSKQ